MKRRLRTMRKIAKLKIQRKGQRTKRNRSRKTHKKIRGGNPRKHPLKHEGHWDKGPFHRWNPTGKPLRDFVPASFTEAIPGLQAPAMGTRKEYFRTATELISPPIIYSETHPYYAGDDVVVTEPNHEDDVIYGQPHHVRYCLGDIPWKGTKLEPPMSLLTIRNGFQAGPENGGWEFPAAGGGPTVDVEGWTGSQDAMELGMWYFLDKNGVVIPHANEGDHTLVDILCSEAEVNEAVPRETQKFIADLRQDSEYTDIHRARAALGNARPGMELGSDEEYEGEQVGEKPGMALGSAPVMGGEDEIFFRTVSEKAPGSVDDAVVPKGAQTLVNKLYANEVQFGQTHNINEIDTNKDLEVDVETISLKKLRKSHEARQWRFATTTMPTGVKVTSDDAMRGGKWFFLDKTGAVILPKNEGDHTLDSILVSEDVAMGSHVVAGTQAFIQALRRGKGAAVRTTSPAVSLVAEPVAVTLAKIETAGVDELAEMSEEVKVESDELDNSFANLQAMLDNLGADD